jgi:hypothetical protein
VKGKGEEGVNVIEVLYNIYKNRKIKLHKNFLKRGGGE